MSAPSYPAWLGQGFAQHVLEQPDVSVVVLDMNLRPLWVNAAWDEFARANGGRAGVPGQGTYVDAIEGPLRVHFTAALEHALATRTVFEQDYECSSPDTRRQFRMRVLPFPDHGLVVEHTLVANGLSHADGEPALESQFMTPDGLIVQCSNCRRVRRQSESESWAWVPAWVAERHPRASHGLCSPCMRYYWGPGRRR